MSSKRKRADSVDDDHNGHQIHAIKKVANSGEGNPPSNLLPTTINPSLLQSASLGMSDGLQDAIADAAVEATHPLEPPHETLITGATNDNRLAELAEIKSRLAILENEVFRKGVPSNSTNDQDELQKKLDMAKVQLKATQNRLQSEQDKLESAQFEFNTARAHLEEQVQEMRGNLESERARCDQLAEDIERIGVAKHAVPCLDGTLQDNLRELRAHIRWFTMTYCDRTISPSSIPDDIRESLSALLRNPIGPFLKSRTHAQYLVESHIWHLLCQLILENPYVVWGQSDMVGRVIQSLLDSSKAPRSTKEVWRVMTGQMLSHTTFYTEKANEWEAKLVSQVKPLTIADVDQKDIMEALKDIIKKSMEIAKILTQNRTQCSVRMGEGTERYHQNSMEIIQRSLKQTDTVDFVVNPALVQLTNSAGDMFPIPRVMIKAEVCFGKGPERDSEEPVPNPRRRGAARTAKNSSGENEDSDQDLGADIIDVADDSSGEYQEGSEATLNSSGGRSSRRKQSSGK